MESSKILHIKKNIKILNKTNKVLYLFTNNLLSINNLIINYLNIQDLTPKYENIEDLKVDSVILKKSLNINSLHFEMFDVLPNIYICMPEYDYDSSIQLDSKLWDMLYNTEKYLIGIKGFLTYLIEEKNFYYKYQMSESLLHNLELYVGLVAKIKSNSKQILVYYSELLELENSKSSVDLINLKVLNEVNALNLLVLNLSNVLSLNLKIKKALSVNVFDTLDKLDESFNYYNYLDSLIGFEWFLKMKKLCFEEFLKMKKLCFEEFLKMKKLCFEEFLKIKKLCFEEFLKIKKLCFEEFLKIKKQVLEVLASSPSLSFLKKTMSIIKNFLFSIFKKK